MPAVTFDPPIVRPNILTVLVDDMGVDVVPQYKAYQEDWLGFNKTPPTSWRPLTTGFKSLKQRGVVFRNAFASPICSPTRAMLLTGRYGARTGVGAVIRDNRIGGLEEFSQADFSAEPTLCEFLKAQDYRTGCFGKWHLHLATEDMDPLSELGAHGTLGWTAPTVVGGFDVFRGHFTNLDKLPHPTPTNGYYDFYWYESDAADISAEPQQITGSHATRYQRQRLQDWILTGGAEPWFAYWATSGLHDPYGNETDQPSGCGPDNTAGTPSVDGDAAHVYTSGYQTQYPYPSVWACMENIAYELERLEDDLGPEIWGRTVVILMGDNGSDWAILDDALNGTTTPGGGLPSTFGTEYEAVIDSHARLKGNCYSPGTRVPLIISGPNSIVRSWNRFSNALVDAVDIHATIRRLSRSNINDAVSDSRGIDGVHLYDVIANVSGADEAHRTWGMSEDFRQNGKISDAVERDTVYRKYRTGSADPNDDGLWHLIRKDSEADELYHTLDVLWDAVDVNEQTDLAASEATILAELQADADALDAAMVDDQWPSA